MPLHIQICIYFKTNKVLNSIPLKKKNGLISSWQPAGLELTVWLFQAGSWTDQHPERWQKTDINNFSTAESAVTTSDCPPWRCGTDLFLWPLCLLLSWSWGLRRVRLGGGAQRRLWKHLRSCGDIADVFPTFSFLLRAWRHFHLVPEGWWSSLAVRRTRVSCVHSSRTCNLRGRCMEHRRGRRTGARLRGVAGRSGRWADPPFPAATQAGLMGWNNCR